MVRCVQGKRKKLLPFADFLTCRAPHGHFLELIYALGHDCIGISCDGQPSTLNSNRADSRRTLMHSENAIVLNNSFYTVSASFRLHFNSILSKLMRETITRNEEMQYKLNKYTLFNYINKILFRFECSIHGFTNVATKCLQVFLNVQNHNIQ